LGSRIATAKSGSLNRSAKTSFGSSSLPITAPMQTDRATSRPAPLQRTRSHEISLRNPLLLQNSDRLGAGPAPPARAWANQVDGSRGWDLRRPRTPSPPGRKNLVLTCKLAHGRSDWRAGRSSRLSMVGAEYGLVSVAVGWRGLLRPIFVRPWRGG
jgi:hypothetical protein